MGSHVRDAPPDLRRQFEAEFDERIEAIGESFMAHIMRRVRAEATLARILKYRNKAERRGCLPKR